MYGEGMIEDHDGLMPVERELTRLMNVARVDAGVSIPRLADHLGVWVSTMTNHITGYQIKTVKVGDVVATCDAIGVSPATLLTRAMQAVGATAFTIPGVRTPSRRAQTDPFTSSSTSLLSPVEQAVTAHVNQARTDAGVSIPALAAHLGWVVGTTTSRVGGHNRKSLRLGDTVAICDAIGVDAGDMLGKAHRAAGAAVGMIDGVVVPDRLCEYVECRKPLAKFDLETHRAEGKRYMLATRRYCCDEHRWQASYLRKKKTA